jgi:hypothetical protein
VSGARLVKVQSPLSRQLARPGGRSLAEAERLADTALQERRQTTFAELGDLVGRLEALCVQPEPGDEAQAYALAAGLVDLAGFFDTGPFYEAAYSLCDLADRSRAAGRWSWEAVGVHVGALRLLHSGGLQPAGPGSADLVAGLRRVVGTVLD